MFAPQLHEANYDELVAKWEQDKMFKQQAKIAKKQHFPMKSERTERKEL